MLVRGVPTLKILLFQFADWNNVAAGIFPFCFAFLFPVFFSSLERVTLHRRAYQMLVCCNPPVKGWTLPHSRTYQTNAWCSPVVESSAPGTVSPQSKFCLRKNGTPHVRVARNPARVTQVVPLPGWPQAPVRSSGSPLHFPERIFCQFPVRVQAISPFRRKPRDPWGPSAWQKTRSQDLGPIWVSQSRGQRMEKLRDWIPGHRCGHRSTCGFD